MQKRWIIKETDRALAVHLSRKLNISYTTAVILANRGIIDVDKAHSFLNPLLKDFRDPFLLNDMDRAVGRILSAFDRQEKIVIHGDYDVDGITATVLLADFFKRMGGEVDFFLPSRADGYGLKKGSIDACSEKGARLIVTVDCGISSVQEIAYARELGIDVVVTDHHEPEGDLPACCAVVNPKRLDSSYPFKDIAGVGVAFKLAHAILKKCKNQGLSRYSTDIDLREYLDLVSLGTIGDVVPLIDENRIIVKYGLQKITEGNRRGIKALKKAAGLLHDIDAGHVSFRLAPRINATGRVSMANKAARLLLCEEEVEAEIIAMELENHNRDRQKIEAEVLKEAFARVEAEIDLSREKIIVVWGENWHHGVIGIVASRLVRKFNRPAVVISLDDIVGKGSARSIRNFHILDALRSCKEHIYNVGGHEGAAGMSIRKDRLEQFRKQLSAAALETISDDDLLPAIDIDAEVRLDELTYSGIKEFERLMPFGYGNTHPVFLSRAVKISRVPKVVGSDHLKMFVDGAGMEIDVVGFGMADALKKMSLKKGDSVDIVYTPEINKFRGEERLQLELSDVRVVC
jgi:single-stranded-DNA-specific exonuclease